MGKERELLKVEFVVAFIITALGLILQTAIMFSIGLGAMIVCLSVLAFSVKKKQEEKNHL